MREEALEYIACPICKTSLDIGVVKEREGHHIISGTLRCPTCSGTYLIARGVPNLLPPMVHSHDLTVGEAYTGYYSLVVPEGPRADSVLYGKTVEEEVLDFQMRMGIEELTLLEGKTFLDAGCGLARIEGVLSQHCSAVLGFDISPSVGQAFEAWRNLSNVHIVRGDIIFAPVLSGKFDLVWCDGVLPYVSDLSTAIAELLRARSPTGFLYSWCYGPRLTISHRLGRAFRATRLPVRVRFSLIYLLSILIKMGISIKKGVNMLKDVQPFAQGVLDASLAAHIHRVSEDQIKSMLTKGLGGGVPVRVEAKDRRIDFWVGSL